jgi:hypothetical protein
MPFLKRNKRNNRHGDKCTVFIVNLQKEYLRVLKVFSLHNTNAMILAAAFWRCLSQRTVKRYTKLVSFRKPIMFFWPAV